MKHLSILAFLTLLTPFVEAATVPVRFREGLVHGFLIMSNLDGNAVADGELLQTADGELVTSRLIYRFHDGSIHEETSTFRQHEVFSLVRYHLVQKGPSFPQSMDVTVERGSGEVTVRSTDRDGKEEVRSTKLDLPPDLANGMVSVLLKNLPPDSPATRFSMLVANPKPRVVHLEISRAAHDPLYVGKSKRNVTRYRVHVKIGGVTGVFASLLGKTPPDSAVWILYEDTPAFIRSENPLFDGSPLMRTELSTPSWTAAR